MVAGAALRFATLSSQSFWLDEAVAIHSARLDFGDLFHSLAHTEGNPPLYFLLLRPWRMAIPGAEFGPRSFSVAAALVTILLLGWETRRTVGRTSFHTFVTSRRSGWRRRGR